jgi:hypothetical protein
MASLSALLAKPDPDILAIERLLDSLEPQSRLEEVTALDGRAQARLFEAAAGHRSIGIDSLVPKDHPPLLEVVHEGKNSLPVFTRFAKVMCRPSTGDEAVLWGYNRNPKTVEVGVGPGYFVAYDHNDGEVLIDYLQVPPDKPAHWPKIISNKKRLSRFVYNGTQDVLRGVSEHVTIGRATRDGKDMPNYFVLCRMD